MRRQQSRFVYPIIHSRQLLTDDYLQWLQSPRQADLFDNLFVRVNPEFLISLSPIVALTVAVTVSTSLETNVLDRIAWLEVIISTMDVRVCAIEPRSVSRTNYCFAPASGNSSGCARCLGCHCQAP